MANKKVLIMGSRSFACQGLPGVLTATGFKVTLFNRGEELALENNVSGSILELLNNKYLNGEFDTIINYIVLKGCSIEANLEYINTLIQFCKKANVQHLIQISSISVYGNQVTQVTENSPIEKEFKNKGPYASLKVAVDNHLVSIKENNLKISFVRPGFILNENSKPPLAGIYKPILPNMGVLLGNRYSVLPTINRTILNQAILKILSIASNHSVFLVFSEPVETKYDFVKKHYKYRVIPMSKNLVILMANILMYLHLLNKGQLNQIKGLFKATTYSSLQTQSLLNLKF